MTRRWSLRGRLTAGAAALTLGTVLTALVLYLGMLRVADRLDSAIAAEARMARYSILSTQVSTFLVVATEAVQTGLPPDQRLARVDPVAGNLRTTFDRIADDLGRAVDSAASAGLDQQSRHGTQSLGLARMRAQFDATLRGLAQDAPPEVLRGHLNGFASNFDPLLNQSVNAEVIFRRETLEGIETLRRTLTVTAVVMGLAAVAMVAAFYAGLIRPQFRRLDRLRAAARQIAQEDFAVALPDTRPDEIGALYAEINRMAAALSARRDAVQTDRARLNEIIEARTAELRAANQALEEADSTRRRFFADISHELRTPLTVILMEAQIGQQAAPEAAEVFATIETRAARLNRRIDDLLRVARSDTGALALDTRPVPLPDLMDEVAEEIGAECDNAGLLLSCDVAPDAQVAGDPNWLRQVLVGLIRNAIRHARDGGRVHLGARIEGTEALLWVADNGPGIPPDRQGAIFDRFAQGARPNAAGFGLGLALARWVAEAHGGSIALTSPLPRAEATGDAAGTKVCLRLPVAAR